MNVENFYDQIASYFTWSDGSASRAETGLLFFFFFNPLNNFSAVFFLVFKGGKKWFGFCCSSWSHVKSDGTGWRRGGFPCGLQTDSSQRAAEPAPLLQPRGHMETLCRPVRCIPAHPPGERKEKKKRREERKKISQPNPHEIVPPFTARPPIDTGEKLHYVSIMSVYGPTPPPTPPPTHAFYFA